MASERFSAELQLLLACARLEMTASDRDAAAAAIARGADWSLLVALARGHGLLPLVHKHVAAEAIDAALVPAAVRRQLSRGATTTARRNMILSREVVDVVRDLEGAGIPVATLKGPVCAQQLYGSIGLRRIGDLDFLCDRARIPDAVERFYARGYLPASGGRAAPIAELRTMHHVTLRHERARINVELHFQLFNWAGVPRVEMSDLSSRLSRVPFFGIDVLTLEAEDLLTYLCIHGAGHAWVRLEWLCGVAELVRADRVRAWSRVMGWAAAMGADRRIALAGMLVRELLGSPAFAPEVREDGGARVAAARIVSRFARAPLAPLRQPEVLALALRLDRSFGGRVARLWDMCFRPKPRDIATIPLPRGLWPLYLLLRPLRLVVEHLRPSAGRASAS